MKPIYKLLSLAVCLMIIIDVQNAFAQKSKDKPADTTKKEQPAKPEEDAATPDMKVTTPDPNAFYADKAVYTFDILNPSNKPQDGKVSYQVFSETGQKLNFDSLKVNVDKKANKKYTFEIPEAKPGFYKVNLMMNITDDDDTARRVFGIRPEQIRSPYKKPVDFEMFWQTAKDELAKVKPSFKTTFIKDSLNRKIYAIEMQSLGNMTIRGWMTIPKAGGKNRKFPVWVGLPGYQVNLTPIMADDDNLAIITLNVRGQGNSRGPIDTRRDEYICYHIENKDNYVMRGAIMDCVRCIDYVFSRSDLRHDDVFVTGGSMGGFLSMATAALDKRVTICSAQNPIFSDVRNLIGEVDWPMSDIIKYAKTRPGLTMDKVLNNMDYFDVKNFATDITCSTLMGIGLLDPLAPPNNEYAAYNNLSGKKRIMVFKDLGHEVNQVFATLEARWMMDTFALF